MGLRFSSSVERVFPEKLTQQLVVRAGGQAPSLSPRFIHTPQHGLCCTVRLN